ncbi:hypothetical protein WEH80_40100 [Actinomycetes bacterium KLBMP 9759]
MTPAQPTPSAPGRVSGRMLWITAAVLALLAISMYEVLSAPSPASSSVVATADCGSSGHDAMCESGLTAAAQVTRPRVGQDDGAPSAAPLAALALIALVALPAMAGRGRWSDGSPPGSPERRPWGRHLLVDIGIARI